VKVVCRNTIISVVSEYLLRAVPVCGEESVLFVTICFPFHDGWSLEKKNVIVALFFLSLLYMHPSCRPNTHSPTISKNGTRACIGGICHRDERAHQNERYLSLGMGANGGRVFGESTKRCCSWQQKVHGTGRSGTKRRVIQCGLPCGPRSG
jgi:hypothetical protein